ncbi:hypothetical protein T439DRAFT_45424 [Meredithblackwellia eburnea MCA 4105]
MNEAGPVQDTPVARPQFQRYINKHGMYTQTMQDQTTFFEDSPSDTPRDHRSTLGRTQSIPDTESQVLTQNSRTQLEADTPTQAPRFGGRPLHRGGGMVGYSDVLEMPATEVELEATLVDDEQEDEGETQEEMEMPSAAQPPRPRNAFQALRQGALDAAQAPVAPPAPAKQRKKNMFALDEAVLSDEDDMGMGGLSDDENEAGMDAELESLVDNEEKDRELVDEEDARADQLRAEHEAKADLEAQARAQAIVDGKDRLKRKGDMLDDDDFDDDNYGMAKRTYKQARVQNKSMADLAANEETQAFANVYKESHSVAIKDDDLAFLQQPEHDEELDLEEREDGVSSPNPYDEDEFEDGESPSRPQRKELDQPIELSRKDMSTAERNQWYLEQGGLQREQETRRSPSPAMYAESSSPDKFKRRQKQRQQSPEVHRPHDEENESQYQSFNSYTGNDWKGESKDESQNVSATTAGSRSAVI